MKLELSVVQSSGNSAWADVTEHGTLKANLAKTDVLFFSAKNLESESRVVVFVKENETDAPKMISCSARLSKLVRKAFAQGAKKLDVLKSLLNLQVVENENGYFIVPEGKQGETFSMADLAKGESIALESLIA